MKPVLCSLVIVGAASAMNNGGDFNGGRPNGSPYFYSEIHSIDFDDEPETDYYYSGQTDYEDVSDSASIVASSLLYEGGCLVSSQAMMCNGGDIEDSAFRRLEFFESEEDLSDDEDDDEDDGHSSMLSNASVRRRKVSAGGSSNTPPTRQRDSSKQTRTVNAAYFESEVQLRKKAGFLRPAFGLGSL